jgi:hypothetical protein
MLQKSTSLSVEIREKNTCRHEVSTMHTKSRIIRTAILALLCSALMTRAAQAQKQTDNKLSKASIEVGSATLRLGMTKLR